LVIMTEPYASHDASEIEPTPQPWSYWSTCPSTHKELKPTCSQVRKNKNHTDETRHWMQPSQIFEQYACWCAGLWVQPPDPR
jgi:hypothetical protein